MEDSTNYSDLESDEYVCKTELKFEQGGVSQKFITSNKRCKEILIPGKLCITENKFGEYIEWKPEEDLSKTSSASEPGSSREWAMVHGSGGESVIGFKARKNEESIEFVPDQKNYSEYRRPIKLEIAEIRSLLIPSRSHGRELIFIMCDGSTQNAFIFERGSTENLISAMERSVCINRAKYNKDLHLVTAKKPDAQVPPPSLAELLLPDQVNHVLGVIQNFRNDPKTMALHTLAKIADYASSQVNAAEGPRTSTPTPTHSMTTNSPNRTGTSPARNGRREDRIPNLENDGLDADYATNEDGYDVIFQPKKLNIELGERRKTYRGQPLSQEQWLNYLDNDGRIQNFPEIKEIVFRGGVDPTMRKHVWIFLLDVYESDSTYEERREVFKELTCSYDIMKRQWSTIGAEQEERFHPFRDFKSLIEKDVARTDRNLDFFSGEGNAWTEVLRHILMTYVMYNFNLGYVQGMSDILSPILMEVQDEVLAFWLFVKFMDRIYRNFELSQESIQQQLRDSYTLLQLVDPRFSGYLQACDADNMYFAFRWLLILFKREFSISDTMTLWENLWTKLPGPNFQLFIGLAILEQHRSTVMENKFGLSEILRHVNDLSMRIDLGETLAGAEAMYLQILEAQDKLPNNIRVIIGLPEKEEPTVPIEVNRLALSPDPVDTLVVINGGDGDTLSDDPANVPTRNINRQSSPVPSAPSPSVDESLEFNCEMGISQFM